jgi:hypothetical protein
MKQIVMQQIIMNLNLTLLCVTGRIFIVDIKPDIDNEKEKEIDTDIDNETGTIYEKMLKLSMNMYLNTESIHNHKKLIKRDALWFN